MVETLDEKNAQIKGLKESIQTQNEVVRLMKKGCSHWLAKAMIRHAKRLGISPREYQFISSDEFDGRKGEVADLEYVYINPNNPKDPRNYRIENIDSPNDGRRVNRNKLTKTFDFIGFDILRKHEFGEYHDKILTCSPKLRVHTYVIDKPTPVYPVHFYSINFAEHFQRAYGYGLSAERYDLLDGAPNGAIRLNTLDRKLAREIHMEMIEAFKKTLHPKLALDRLLETSKYRSQESKEYSGKPLMEWEGIFNGMGRY